MNAIARRRYSKSAPVILVLILLAALTALGFAASGSPAQATTANANDVAEGQKLFAANCASCHGMSAQGTPGVAPSLVGVGAAAVDFQVGTGRMPAQQAGPQIEAKRPQFNDAQIGQLAAYVASLGEGPAIPTAEMVDPKLGDPAKGMQLFRTNCAMCHSFAGKGGALTKGKYAPDLSNTTPQHIYEALETGPQSMPVFSDTSLSPKDKQDIITWLRTINTAPAPGGISLGSLGPVNEGLVGWIVGLVALIGCAVWLGAKSS